MSVVKEMKIGELVNGNPYVGRGIVIGKSQDGKSACFAYFIMGRSVNSRNRIFVEEGKDVTIYPFDAEKAGDPTLIIYSPVKCIGDKVIVTNGNQTDTIYDFIKEGKTFEQALLTREFEPDAPNLTPRISGMLDFSDGFTYKMSILKAADNEGTACNRFTFDYRSLDGIGHFIHTYKCDGNPIPTFEGEPERVIMPNTANELADDIWANLNEDNKISLYVRYINLETGKEENILINKNK